jgi:hypothetical protein
MGPTTSSAIYTRVLTAVHTPGMVSGEAHLPALTEGRRAARPMCIHGPYGPPWGSRAVTKPLGMGELGLRSAVCPALD